METTRQRLAALTLCLLALASVMAATAPAAAQTGAGNDDAGVSNATELDASFEYDVVEGCRLGNQNATTPLTLTANRERYDVTVQANDINGALLADVFADERRSDDPAITNIEQLNDTAIRMTVSGRNVTVPANFSTVGNGDYALTFETDGGATATAEIFYPHIDCADATFLRGGSYESSRSDIVTIPIVLEYPDDIRVHIRNGGLSLTANVEDGNDDGLVTLSLNTHLIGRNAPDDGHGRGYWTREGISVHDSNDTITGITVDDIPGGEDPLPTGEYDLVVDNGKSEYRLGTAPLSITGTALTDFESWMGPADTLTNATAGDLRRAIANGTLVDNESVSNESALVYEIQSASVFGPLEAAASQYDGSDRYAQAFLDIAGGQAASTVPGNPVTFDIAADSGARIDLRETYRNDGLVFAPDRDNRTLYVGLRTDRLAVTNGTAVGSGQEFEANLTINGEISRQPVTFREVNATLVLPSTPQTPVASTPNDPGTEQDRSETPDTQVSTTVGLATAETPAPTADDTTEESPDATTTVNGPGFGIAAVVLAVLALSTLAAGRRRE